jgi:hypothetical protein
LSSGDVKKRGLAKVLRLAGFVRWAATKLGTSLRKWGATTGPLHSAPKGQDKIAQGKRSAALGKKRKCFCVSTLKGWDKHNRSSLSHPFRVRRSIFSSVRQPRAALRLPWAVMSCPFGAECGSLAMVPHLRSAVLIGARSTFDDSQAAHITRSSAHGWRRPVSNSLYSRVVASCRVCGLYAVLIMRKSGTMSASG